MNRKEYILHLIGEVAHVILDGEPSRMVISLHQEADGLHLAVFDDSPRSDEEIRAMQQSLGGARRPELAGYYGGMAGFDLLGAGRLNLIGWQVKHADVSRVEDTTRINLWLGGESFTVDPSTITGGAAAAGALPGAEGADDGDAGRPRRRGWRSRRRRGTGGGGATPGDGPPSGTSR